MSEWTKLDTAIFFLIATTAIITSAVLLTVIGLLGLILSPLLIPLTTILLAAEAYNEEVNQQ